MKRLLILVLLASSLALATTTHAQSSSGQVIPLTDASPAMDIVVQSQPGASGALALQLSGASVLVTDAGGQTIFQMADQRAHELQLRFGPEATSHTVTIARLPGIQQAWFSATPLDDLPAVDDATTAVSENRLQIGQSLEALVSADQTPGAIAFAIPDGQFGRLVSSFSGAPLDAQILDAAGVPIAHLNPSLIDGLSLTLDGGQYALDLSSTATNAAAQVEASVTTAADTGLPAPVTITAAAAEPAAPVQAAPAADCTIQLTANTEVHSGPGATYSLMGYAPRGITLLVGGVSKDGQWTLVGDGRVSGWVPGAPGNVTGDCSQITTYDIAPAPANAAPSLSVNPQPPAGEQEHEGQEAGEFEGGDD